MAAPSAALLLDPLAEDAPQPTNVAISRQSASAKRGETIAPELAGFLAERAVAAVRALGLIAAIEGLDTSDTDQHGVVVEQDPSAGTRLGRDGIVVLRIGQPAGEPADDEPAVEKPPRADVGLGGAEDDTEAWFATLAPTLGGPVPGAGASTSRRLRKHRGARVPVEQMVFDTPPDPLPATRLPRPSVSAAWRRCALVLAGAILGLVLLTRGGVSHSHRQALAPLAQAPTSHPRIMGLPASEPVGNRPPAGRLQRRPAQHGTPRRAPREPIVAAASASAPHARATQASAAPPPPASPTAGAHETAGQFSYLGQ